MTEHRSIARTIVAKDISDAANDRFVIVTSAFLVVAAMIALIVGAIALNTDVATYQSATQALLDLGKSAQVIAKPEFYPLKLLRGFLEHLEILGAVIAILIGYRAAASERGRQTLSLILTRPVSRLRFLGAKIMGGMSLIAIGLTGAFAIGALTLNLVSGVVLSLDDYLRLITIDLAAIVYSSIFFLLGFGAALWAKKLPNALLFAFTIWLGFVLIAPQIGDTMDPDNQVAGGVFRQLHMTKDQEHAVMASFATYETIRNGIEISSPTKHFERLSFAITGVKTMFTGQPLGTILWQKLSDLEWLLAIAAFALALVLILPLDPNRLAKE